jgi:HEAT repeat protein
MSAVSDSFWRLLRDVRPHERQRFVFFGGLLLLGSVAQTLGLVGVESLFLARFGVERLPLVFIAASLSTVLGSLVYAAWVGRSRNDELFVRMLAVAALVLAGAGLAVLSGLDTPIPPLFCLYFLFQAVFMNHFLTFAVDYFDSAASKRLFPLFTIGASVGGAAGGALGVGLARSVGTRYLVIGWALTFAACALLVRLARRRLRRWGPLDLEETDETSVEGIRGALRYLRASALGRALVLSALGMVLALFVGQYLYSQIFVEAFPHPGDLASFFGVYLAVTNVIEIGVGLTLTPWLIRRLGVASANLVHPVLTFLSYAGLFLNQGLASGIIARVNKELIDNSMGFPVRSLVYNAMPVRLRGRMRAFLEGIVVYAGMSGAGALLLLLGRPDPVWLCAAGAAAAVVFLLANLLARREYVRSLVSQLRTGRLDLSEIGNEIGNWEAARLAELWEEMLQREGARPSRALLEIIPHLAQRGIVAPLVRELAHPSPQVRRTCVLALAGVEGPEVDAALEAVRADPEPGVRLAALRAAQRRGATGEAAARALLDDPTPEVRAEAAAGAGEPGLAVLREMAGSADPRSATCALGVAPAALLDAVRARFDDPDPAVRAAALEAGARISDEPPLAEEQVLEAARHADARVRRAAVLLLGNLEGDEARSALASALADPAAEVAASAETLLGGLGRDGAEAAAPQLHSDLERAVVRALGVLAATESRDRLTVQLRERVCQLWYQVVAFQELPEGSALGERFLRAAYQDAILRSLRLCFRILELLEDRSVIRKVERSLRHASTRLRGDALEVLSNLGDRVAAQLLVLLHERTPLHDKIRAVERLVPVPRSSEDVIDASLRSDLRFVRMGARACALLGDEGAVEEDTMVQLLALKQVPLFSQLSLEQLEAVLRVASEREYTEGEVICHEGDPGDVLFILVEGRVDFYKGFGKPTEHRLGTYTEGSYFGEMAILDDESRTATAVAAQPTRLLCLAGDSLKELILQMPQISFEILRVLTARVRAAEARLAER